MGKESWNIKKPKPLSYLLKRQTDIIPGVCQNSCLLQFFFFLLSIGNMNSRQTRQTTSQWISLLKLVVNCPPSEDMPDFKILHTLTPKIEFPSLGLIIISHLYSSFKFFQQLYEGNRAGFHHSYLTDNKIEAEVTSRRP